MSVLDQLRALEQQVQQRLRELRPLVAEYRDLEKVAQRLGLKRDEGETTETAAPKPAALAKGKATLSRARPRKPKSTPRPPKRAASKRRSKRAATEKPEASAATEPKRSAKPRPAAKPKAAAAVVPKSTAESKPAAAVEPKPTAKPKPAPASGLGAAAKPSARKRAAAAPGQRQQDVLRLVRERPGITVAELAGQLGVDATGLYGVVRRLQGRGEISKDGTRLQPVAQPTATTDASARPSAAPGAASPATDAAAGPDAEPTPPTAS